jgi:hypothetical protein
VRPHEPSTWATGHPDDDDIREVTDDDVASLSCFGVDFPDDWSYFSAQERTRFFKWVSSQGARFHDPKHFTPWEPATRWVRGPAFPDVDEATLGRFGDLRPAFVVQYAVPVPKLVVKYKGITIEVVCSIQR